jgi:RNA polymerase sigma factor (sigma-70 family)
MAHLATGSIVPRIEALFDGGSASGLTDRELLERFTNRHDVGAEAAFTTLVARHGPMVLGICRQILRDRQLAEDAFQAVFLVLAFKARSIRNPDLAGCWLHGVALRTARRAKSRLNRQRKNEEGDAVSGHVLVATAEATACQPDISAMAREQAEILHVEVARLPRPFRLPVILCYFEGHAIDEAARRLKWPVGTFRSRLARAREKLRRGLERRGVASPTTALAAALSPRSSSASVSSQICEMTTGAAMSFVAGQATEGVVSAAARALAKEVVGSMLLDNVRVVVLTSLLLGALVAGVGMESSSPPRVGGPNVPAAEQPPIAKRPNEASPRPAPGRMFVIGRVLDPERKPVPDATAMVYSRTKGPRLSDVRGRITTSPLGQARGDGLGRFRLDAPRTTSSRNDLFGAVARARLRGRLD